MIRGYMNQTTLRAAIKRHRLQDKRWELVELMGRTLMAKFFVRTEEERVEVAARGFMAEINPEKAAD